VVAERNREQFQRLLRWVNAADISRVVLQLPDRRLIPFSEKDWPIASHPAVKTELVPPVIVTEAEQQRAAAAAAAKTLPSPSAASG